MWTNKFPASASANSTHLFCHWQPKQSQTNTTSCHLPWNQIQSPVYTDNMCQSRPNYSFNKHVMSTFVYNVCPRRRNYSGTPSLRTAQMFVEKEPATKPSPYWVWGPMLGIEDRKGHKPGCLFTKVCHQIGMMACT